jgi:hypothetical protein
MKCMCLRCLSRARTTVIINMPPVTGADIVRALKRYEKLNPPDDHA